MSFNKIARSDQLVHTYVDEHGLAALTARAGADGTAIVQAALGLDWKRPHDAIWWHADIARLRELAEKAAGAADIDDASRLISRYGSARRWSGSCASTIRRDMT